jgi:hypothetical protein
MILEGWSYLPLLLASFLFPSLEIVCRELNFHFLPVSQSMTVSICCLCSILLLFNFARAVFWIIVGDRWSCSRVVGSKGSGFPISRGGFSDIPIRCSMKYMFGCEKLCLSILVVVALS